MKRLYRAACLWLEAGAEAMSAEQVPEPGDTFSQAEVADPLPTRPALHIGYGRQSGDDDDGGVYRARPISMRWQGN